VHYASSLAAGTRVAADTAARAEAATLGDPLGGIRAPVLTLHTYADPLVIVQNESWFAVRVAADSQSAGHLVQLVTVPPARFAERTGAPYGAGHCNVDARTRVGMITVLDDWVRRGIYPGAVSVSAALGTTSGFVAGVRVPVWPLGGTQPADR
jgi:hypothetical protein